MRVNLFLKGNLDVHDSLHSCRVGGQVVWNGVNEILRARDPAIRIRLVHETWTRSDALLAASGAVPAGLAARGLPLGSFPAASQFSTALFAPAADAIILSVQPDVCVDLVRHRQNHYLFNTSDFDKWPATDRAWLRDEFRRIPMLDPAASRANFAAIVARIRSQTEAPILIYNLSPFVPGEAVHCYQGLGETFATRVRRFNLGLVELSMETGVSIIDVETIVARIGAEQHKLDALHLTAEAYRLIADEVVRVLGDLGVIPAG
jgi:hypothetical protein